jgi:hypothetical protein
MFTRVSSLRQTPIWGMSSSDAFQVIDLKRLFLVVDFVAQFERPTLQKVSQKCDDFIRKSTFG